MQELIEMLARFGGMYYVDNEKSVTVTDVHRTRTEDRPYDYSVHVKFLNRRYEVTGQFWAFANHEADLQLILTANKLPLDVAHWA